MKMKTKKTEKKPSPYYLLEKWLKDGKKDSPIPEEVVSAKNIGVQYILYHFQDSEYILPLSNLFNNYNIFSLDRLEMLRYLKRCVRHTHFKRPFSKFFRKSEHKLAKALHLQYPFLKKWEVNILCDQVDQSDDKTIIYEMFGLKTDPRKKKMSKKDKKIFLNRKNEEEKEKNDEPEKKVETEGVSLEGFMANLEIKEV